MNWAQRSKDKWEALTPSGERHSPYIKRLDEDWWSCYRNGRYLGRAKTFSDAKSLVEKAKVE